MNDEIAITGSLVDVRNVNQHKCARLLIDVPAEQAASIVSAFGWPTMVNPVPVAVARLQQPDSGEGDGPSTHAAAYMSTPSVSRRGGPEAKRRFSELPPSQQAAIRCAEPAFQRWLEGYGRVAHDAREAAECVRGLCGVESRSELDVNEEASAKWLAFNRRFEAWKLSQQYGENLAR